MSLRAEEERPGPALPPRPDSPTPPKSSTRSDGLDEDDEDNEQDWTLNAQGIAGKSADWDDSAMLSSLNDRIATIASGSAMGWVGFASAALFWLCLIFIACLSCRCVYYDNIWRKTFL